MSNEFTKNSETPAKNAATLQANNGTNAEYFSIGDLSREYNVTLRALRFYEDKGLLAPKREGTSRLYSRADRIRLGLILKGKRFGFTLTEISAMIALHEGRDSGKLALTQEKVQRQITALEKRRSEIDEAIAELQALLGSASA